MYLSIQPVHQHHHIVPTPTHHLMLSSLPTSRSLHTLLVLILQHTISYYDITWYHYIIQLYYYISRRTTLLITRTQQLHVYSILPIQHTSTSIHTMSLPIPMLSLHCITTLYCIPTSCITLQYSMHTYISNDYSILPPTNEYICALVLLLISLVYLLIYLLSFTILFKYFNAILLLHLTCTRLLSDCSMLPINTAQHLYTSLCLSTHPGMSSYPSTVLNY